MRATPTTGLTINAPPRLLTMLNKTLIAWSVGAALCALIPTHAQASGNASFVLTATASPSTCNVTLTDGIANLGSLSIATVKTYPITAGAYTFPPITVPINIFCSAAANVAVSFVDNLSGKRLALGSNDAVRYGMVDGTGTTAIGQYGVVFTSTTTIDSVAVGQYLSAPNGTTTIWSSTSYNGLPASMAGPGLTIGFSKTAAAITPDAFTTLSGGLIFYPFISSAYIGAATGAVYPRGSGTLTLVYL